MIQFDPRKGHLRYMFAHESVQYHYSWLGLQVQRFKPQSTTFLQIKLDSYNIVFNEILQIFYPKACLQPAYRWLDRKKSNQRPTLKILLKVFYFAHLTLSENLFLAGQRVCGKRWNQSIKRGKKVCRVQLRHFQFMSSCLEPYFDKVQILGEVLKWNAPSGKSDGSGDFSFNVKFCRRLYQENIFSRQKI